MITPQRTVDIALAILRKDILQGKYPPLTLLPSERKLSETLSINRQTLRSALARLETEGLIQPYHGRGIQVLNYKDTASIRILAHVASSKELDDFFSLRKNLAAEAAALACTQATIHSLNNLREIAIEQHSNTDMESFFHGDIRFTTTLVHCSNSLPLRLLFNSFTKILHGQKEAALQSLSNREASLQSYMALIALIRNRDPLLCRKAILLPTELTPEDQQQIQSALSLEMNAE